MSVAIWWVRRDLRLHDNAALHAALQAGTVIPVFVLDPGLTAVSRRRTDLLVAYLRALDRSLHGLGSSLVVRRGRPSEVIAALAQASGARVVYAHADVSPLARCLEAEVARCVHLKLVGWPTAVPPDVVRTADGRGYTVYAHYRHTVLAHPLDPLLLPTPGRLTPHGLPSEPLPQSPVAPSDGEVVARQRLTRFAAEAIFRYHLQRDRLDLEGTSQLSPYLRFGVLSPRVVLRAALDAEAAAADPESRRGAQRWRDELLWREFFAHLLYHYPHTRKQPLRRAASEPVWDNDERLFRAWCEGRTGYPVVDAAIRQLNETGWIHNRARMVAASFLVKNLLVDWRWGESYFLRQLADGDPASNTGNWQWVTGTGADAAPYFRVFNPVLQGRRFDPEGRYVRRWVPELSRVPAPYVHAPWTLPRDDQVALRCRVGRDYPAPVVDLRASRDRAVERYRRARGLSR